MGLYCVTLRSALEPTYEYRCVLVLVRVSALGGPLLIRFIVIPSVLII